jgi:hypothetical protein
MLSVIICICITNIIFNSNPNLNKCQNLLLAVVSLKIFRIEYEGREWFERENSENREKREARRDASGESRERA